MLYYTTLFEYSMLCYVMLCYAMLCHAMPHHIAVCGDTLTDAMPHQAGLCHNNDNKNAFQHELGAVMSCYILLCYITCRAAATQKMVIEPDYTGAHLQAHGVHAQAVTLYTCCEQDPWCLLSVLQHLYTCLSTLSATS